ncbi:RNA-binding cell elongation regulator Jag/EloR [Facklamia sp. 7083-14-GEN3]|uniref:RNA-binding cell elongation regulator Jag/EloR n=1 Tax=Facklamia sp. 7083-14-GEN3 TaxID=2973478 RepID=UPI00215C262E|nr:RNA-binding cell elongation regulator Jag/EloR [Facklamia sp. 7083-14-GEN3]MCR8969842.1 Jag N-terminal domain-containing protein [Facklamia sp. 7083-14-GEN3]
MLDHNITVRAENVESAIEKGLKQLQISREGANIRIISEGKKGFFGFGKQEAVVHIEAKTDLSLKELTNQLEKEVKIDHKTNHSHKEAVSNTKDYIRQNNQKNSELVEEEDLKQKKSENLSLEKESSIEKQAEDKNSTQEPEIVVPQMSEKASNETQTTVKEDIKNEISIEEEFQAACHYLEEVIRLYGAESHIEYELKGNQLVFNIETDKSGLVIGKHGKIINSLQTLVQVLLHRRDRKRISVLLNVGDYRDRRLNVLEQMAERTAEQVLSTKQTVILDPLPAYERKQIHAYLGQYDHISTHSEGKDPNRYLVVDYVQ